MAAPAGLPFLEDETGRFTGSLLPLAVFVRRRCHMATYHPLYFLYCEAQLGRRNGTECVPVFLCVCVCVRSHIVPAT